MREIKFRAWDRKGKKWIDPVNFFIFGDGDIAKALWSEDEDEEDPFDFELTDDYIPVRFTGLHDKGGREIYEGDIIDTTYFGIYTTTRGSVFWADNYGGFCIDSRIDPTNPKNYCLLHDEVARHGEVIGNIYENPELLKGTADDHQA